MSDQRLALSELVVVTNRSSRWEQYATGIYVIVFGVSEERTAPVFSVIELVRVVAE
jgi:hypothetical protein